MAKQKFNFDTSVAQVEDIIGKIERNEMSLNDMFDQVKYAVELLDECKKTLFEAESSIAGLFDATKKS
ncbi:MAG: Exonuclease small subunit [Bacteroidota bacterium]|jgi:exodeoxyribonuclease VII small subunit